MTTVQTDKPLPGEATDDFAASPFMRWVKVAMVVMGVLIVAGFVFIAYEVWRRQTDPEYAAQVDRRRLTAPAGEAAAPVARPVVPTAVAGTPFVLPAGARIVDQTPMGSRLAVRVDLADGAQVIYLVSQGSRAVEIQPVMTAPAR